MEQTPERAAIRYSCDLCGYSFPQEGCRNVGNKEYPKWRCRQCITSANWYDKVLLAQDIAPGDLKKNALQKYRQNVMRFRIPGEHDPPELKAECKCLNKSDRLLQKSEYLEEEAVVTGVKG